MFVNFFFYKRWYIWFIYLSNYGYVGLIKIIIIDIFIIKIFNNYDVKKILLMKKKVLMKWKLNRKCFFIYD